MPFWQGPALGGIWTNAANWNGGVPNATGAIAFIDTPDYASAHLSAIVLPTASTIRVGTLDLLIGQNDLFRIVSEPGTSTVFVFDNGASNAVLNYAQIPGALGLEFFGTYGLTVRLDSDLDINVTGGSVTFYSPITGTKGIEKIGAGTLYLHGNNSFSGGVNLRDGTLSTTSNSGLGSGTLTISNDALFHASSSVTINNVIMTSVGAAGTAGSASIAAAAGQTLTFTGTLNHLSQGILTFGSSASNGTIVASFSVSQSSSSSLSTSGFTLDGGTLRIGNAAMGTGLLFNPGTGANRINTGATLDTNGHLVFISNLDLDGGTITSVTGGLSVNVQDISTTAAAQNGTITGTALADNLEINALNNFSLQATTFTNWTQGTDLILIKGSSGNNTLTGSNRSDTIRGFDGADTLFGFGGIDTIEGGNGNDLITLNINNNGSAVDGGADTDTLRVLGGTIGLTNFANFEALDIQGGGNLVLSGLQFANGLITNAQIVGIGTLTVNMTAGVKFLAQGMSISATVATVVNGTSGLDIIKLGLGTSTNNTVNGGDGVDQIRGSQGVDTIRGDGGNDKIFATGGADILTGGSGADQFRYMFASDSGLGAAADRITDFALAEDRLNFQLIDADAVTPGDQAFGLIGTAAFTNTGIGQIRYQNSGADLLVQIDTDGNGVANMEVILQGLNGQTLTGSNFLL